MDRDERIWHLRKWQREGRFLDGPPGRTAQWDSQDGARLRDWRQSIIHEGRLQDPGLPQEHAFSIPVLQKRTAQQRLESMIQRLVDEDPTVQAKILEGLAVEYWKQGAPVTTDALRKAAADILNKADQRIRTSNRLGG